MNRRGTGNRGVASQTSDGGVLYRSARWRPISSSPLTPSQRGLPDADGGGLPRRPVPRPPPHRRAWRGAHVLRLPDARDRPRGVPPRPRPHRTRYPAHPPPLRSRFPFPMGRSSCSCRFCHPPPSCPRVGPHLHKYRPPSSFNRTCPTSNAPTAHSPFLYPLLVSPLVSPIRPPHPSSHPGSLDPLPPHISRPLCCPPPPDWVPHFPPSCRATPSPYSASLVLTLCQSFAALCPPSPGQGAVP